ncbi:MAG: hypothetical protein A2836_02540 [Candidatus Taylorbacteria bacterium RIFCSPHIGHO2_01_FULL_45_63]|nr:MAG: hypothetical protein A2836_02540 [Candidatus Taylorbacteria bacterium RIFCSPHIGHO2_01_FULL_45_63]OHA33288.1 MAG: hypothetical protein A3A22_01760 [Candidatus Taylorbacteria bacterium RIFCSPLOWO2_01_FULL_45_34b]
MTSPKKPIIFFIRSAPYIRAYRSIILALLGKGFPVVGIFDPRELDQKGMAFLTDLQIKWPGFSYLKGFRRHGFWKMIILPLREVRNYRRFLVVETKSSFYENRCRRFLPRPIQFFIRTFPWANRFIRSAFLGWVLEVAEKLTLVDRAITLQIKNLEPCFALIAFRNQPSNSPDLDYLKSAKSLGIQTAIPTPSWDNLTSKGLIQIIPDRLFVWNEDHVAAAIEHHGIPLEKISIVGAYQFDEWFEKNLPTTSRDEFCKTVNLRPEDPIVLYMGSSATTNDGPRVIEDLWRALDLSNDRRLSKVQLLVRPYPMNTGVYEHCNLKGVSVVPKVEVDMNEDKEVNLLFDSIYHSIAVITVHTTGVIDALIKDKPGIVLLRKDFEVAQDAIHFKHLREHDAVLAAEGEKECADMISRILDGHDEKRESRHAFIQKYLRPHGTQVEVGEIVARRVVEMINHGV